MAFDRIHYRQPGMYDVDEASLETATDLTGVQTLTQQHMGPATEMDYIMRQFYQTGEMPRARHVAEYGDFDEANDLNEMLQQIELGKKAFTQIPANIRGMFDNDPGKFLTWIHDDANYNEAAELGLVPGINPVESQAVREAAQPVADNGNEIQVEAIKP